MEIIGKNLDRPMEVVGIGTEKTYEAKGESPLQVWELTDEAYAKLNQLGEDQWEVDYGWWRTGGCIYEGKATVEFTVNGKTMMGYAEGNYAAYKEDGDLEPDTEFDSFTDWFYESMGLSKNTNLAIFAESLARDNNMKLSEFMTKYEG